MTETEKQWRIAHKDELNQRAREWRLANANRVKENRKCYYDAHKDRTKRDAGKWAKRHPERVTLRAKAIGANRIYGHTGRLTTKEVETVVERCGRKCHWCGKENLADRDFTLEHLKPINDVNVLTIACHACNTGQAVKNGGRIQTPEERRAKFLAYQREYRSRPEVKTRKRKRSNGSKKIERGLGSAPL